MKQWRGKGFPGEKKKKFWKLHITLLHVHTFVCIYTRACVYVNIYECVCKYAYIVYSVFYVDSFNIQKLSKRFRWLCPVEIPKSRNLVCF